MGCLIQFADCRGELYFDGVVELDHVLDQLCDLVTLGRDRVLAGPDHGSLPNLLQTDLEIFDFSHSARFVHIVQEASLVKLRLKKLAHQWVLSNHFLLPRG